MSDKMLGAASNSNSNEIMDKVPDKVKKGMELLLLKRHRLPGASLAELKRSLGNDYPKVLEEIEDRISPLGLELKRTEERAFITFKMPVEPTYVPRIDELAILTASIAYILANGEKIKRNKLENFLKEKFSRRRTEIALSKFIRQGYIEEDEGYFAIGFRTRAEVDMAKLSKLILK